MADLEDKGKVTDAERVDDRKKKKMEEVRMMLEMAIKKATTLQGRAGVMESGVMADELKRIAQDFERIADEVEQLVEEPSSSLIISDSSSCTSSPDVRNDDVDVDDADNVKRFKLSHGDNISSSSSSGTSDSDASLDLFQAADKHRRKEEAARWKHRHEEEARSQWRSVTTLDLEPDTDILTPPLTPDPYVECLAYQPFPPAVFQVERSPEDRAFLRRLQYYDTPPPDRVFNPAVKDELVFALLQHTQCGARLEDVRLLSEKANNFVFYESLVKSIAFAASFLYPDHYLDYLAHSRAQNVNANRYTPGPDFADLLLTPFFQEIKDIVSKMEFWPRLKVDEYSRMLISFARSDAVKYKESLLVEVAELIDIDAMYKLETFESVDNSVVDVVSWLCYYFRFDIKKQLAELVRQLEVLNDGAITVSSYVYEVIEVAELRRRALGCSVINAVHLMWAFYEIGYGLPPEILKPKKFKKATREQPLSDVFMTSIRFAQLFEQKKMELEHFVFAVMYVEEFGDEGQQDSNVLGMKDRFDEFMTEVASDYNKKPKPRTFLCDGSIFKLYGLDSEKITVGIRNRENS